jgi:glycosyltransferase involved in cell wall biosynthesis
MSMLDRITPVLITYNEAANIARTLAHLTWARDIVIVDSGSGDDTLALIARTAPQARVFARPFDCFQNQWNFALRETGIATDWALALDADYIVPEGARSELAGLDADGAIDAYEAQFVYLVSGQPLRGTLYPPVTTLFRCSKAHYVQDGHTQRVVVDGTVGRLRERFHHDDRKPLSRWLASQDRYMINEIEKFSATPPSELRFVDKVRQYPLIAPFAVFANCYLVKRGFLDGRAGLFYALQRMLAETLLGLRVLEHRMSGDKTGKA